MTDLAALRDGFFTVLLSDCLDAVGRPQGRRIFDNKPSGG
jgi:hypothetical protein